MIRFYIIIYRFYNEILKEEKSISTFYTSSLIGFTFAQIIFFVIINLLNVKEFFSEKLMFFSLFLIIWFSHISIFYLLGIDKKLIESRDINIKKTTVLAVNIFILVIVSLLFLLAMRSLRASNT